MPSGRRAAPRPSRRGWLTAASVGTIAIIAVVMTVVVGGGRAPSVGEPEAARMGVAAATPVPDGVAKDAEAMARSVPRRVRVPAIGVDSRLMALGLLDDGTLQTPPSAFPAGWFTGAPTPGELGPAVIVGHVRYEEPGVFARLSEVRPGDAIHVDRTDGDTATFRVTRVDTFAKSSFPTEQVYGNIPFAGLRLITCGGLNGSTNEFDDNIVVFAELVP